MQARSAGRSSRHPRRRARFSGANWWPSAISPTRDFRLQGRHLAHQAFAGGLGDLVAAVLAADRRPHALRQVEDDEAVHQVPGLRHGGIRRQRQQEGKGQQAQAAHPLRLPSATVRSSISIAGLLQSATAPPHVRTPRSLVSSHSPASVTRAQSASPARHAGRRPQDQEDAPRRPVAVARLHRPAARLVGDGGCVGLAAQAGRRDPQPDPGVGRMRRDRYVDHGARRRPAGDLVFERRFGGCDSAVCRRQCRSGRRRVRCLGGAVRIGRRRRGRRRRGRRHGWRCGWRRLRRRRGRGRRLGGRRGCRRWRHRSGRRRCRCGCVAREAQVQAVWARAVPVRVAGVWVAQELAARASAALVGVTGASASCWQFGRGSRAESAGVAGTRSCRSGGGPLSGHVDAGFTGSSTVFSPVAGQPGSMSVMVSGSSSSAPSAMAKMRAKTCGTAASSP